MEDHYLNVYDSDTIEVLPGERFGVLLTGTMNYNGNIVVEYFNLNNGEVEGTQNALVDINGFIGIPDIQEELVKMYPNPASGELTIELPESDERRCSGEQLKICSDKESLSIT